VTERRVERLAALHDVEGFDCGEEPLNRFLTRFALQNQRANASQTYVGLVGDEIIGFYSLAVGEVAHADAPDRLKKGLARHPVPVMVLARLAVSTPWQGKGVGRGLLADAVRRTFQAAEIAGIRALVVHAKNDDARSFYERVNFTPSPTDPLHLFALISDLRKIYTTD
jgi:GNAT superfamily N-acetyltransferase